MLVLQAPKDIASVSKVIKTPVILPQSLGTSAQIEAGLKNLIKEGKINQDQPLYTTAQIHAMIAKDLSTFDDSIAKIWALPETKRLLERHDSRSMIRIPWSDTPEVANTLAQVAGASRQIYAKKREYACLISTKLRELCKVTNAATAGDNTRPKNDQPATR